MFDFPIYNYISELIITSTIGSNDSCQVEERSDHVVALERFKVLQLNGGQFQLFVAVINFFHLMIPRSKWRDRVSTNTTRIYLFHTKEYQV
jgi:hypothetical protein